jgi:hypothetical protein
MIRPDRKKHAEQLISHRANNDDFAAFAADDAPNPGCPPG